MLTYLFDTSAVVHNYVEGDKSIRKAVKHILEQKTLHKKASLFIPNICIAEVFNALARRRFNPKGDDQPLDHETYKRHLGKFRKHIHWGRTLYPYDVNRYHIVGVDNIIPVEHTLAREHRRDHLSAFDILVIAMACELAYIGKREDTFLVTCDKRMKQVVDEMRKPRASDGTVPGPLGELDKDRWIPPVCLDLRKLEAGELKHVQGQHPFNP